MSTSKTIAGYAKRVVQFLKQGDEEKVTRFFERNVAANKKQIRIREERITELKDDISDLKETQIDTALVLDLERVNDYKNYIRRNSIL